MATDRSWTKTIFGGLWSLLNFIRSAFFNLIFILIVIFIFSIVRAGNNKITVPDKSALVLNITGNIVIQKHVVDPVSEFMNKTFGQNRHPPEILLQDILFAIHNAKDDPRIKTLVLDLDSMGGAGLNKLQQIADAIDDFKTSGKPVYATGDDYSQNQYFLAAHADHLYLNPMGSMMLQGYARYGLYFKSALDKIKATTHVFRVGTYKSYVEPYIRDDMSDAARQANEAWLNAMWGQYKASVAKARNIAPSNFDEKISQLMPKLEQVNGDFAQYALQNHWVDALKTRDEVRTELAKLVGSSDDKRGFRNIGLNDYLDVTGGAVTTTSNPNKVAIVVADGEILNGTQSPGTVGGDSTARMLRQARLDKNVKAVVLYVDSPGGSAFASEIIRQEVENLKAAGKPVVVQMSSVAASGGYWISASADQIWAAPSTITGSIGIFGMFMTFENTLDYLGVHADGLATTELAGVSPMRPLDPRLGDIFQRTIENGYDKFISMVAKQRGMTKEQVDHIAQGRVWIGTTAQKIGLVDHLGYLNDAIASAAKLAKLKSYGTEYIQPKLSEKDRLLKKIFGTASVLIGQVYTPDQDVQLMGLVNKLLGNVKDVARLNDPRGVYSFCLACEPPQ